MSPVIMAAVISFKVCDFDDMDQMAEDISGLQESMDYQNTKHTKTQKALR